MSKKREIENASQFPKVYYARHMHSGLCGYDDAVILVDTAVMKKMMPSFTGKPVYVLHDDRSQEERAADIDSADGYVTETFYNEVDGWVWSKILVKTDIGINKIEVAGWDVSNAYIPEAWGLGGTKHNCQYDKELLDAEFTHLAIVPNPRYEDACVMTPNEFKIYQENERETLNELKNSKSKKGFTMKMFKKTEVKNSEIDDDTLIEIKNAAGEIVTVSVKEMANALVSDKQKKEQLNAKIDVAGEKLTVKELSSRYTELMNKKNSDDKEKENMDDDEYDNEDDDEKSNEDDERDNEDDDETANMDDEYDNEDDEKENEDDTKSEKSNSKKRKNHFSEMKNANKRKGVVRTFDTPQNKVQRGKNRYGSSQ